MALRKHLAIDIKRQRLMLKMEKNKLTVALCLEANNKFDVNVNTPLQPFLTALNDKNYFWQPVK